MKLIGILLELIKRFTSDGTGYARKKGVKIGNDCRIYTTGFGSEPFLITIGDRVTVTSGVKFITHDGSTWLMRDNKGRRYYYAPIEIGNDIFIGLNSIIMPGVKIEDRVIVGAGSVVTKSIPSGVVVVGVPAKIIGSYDEIKKRMLETYVSEMDYDKSTPYKERILKIVSKKFKPFMKQDI
jgi:acetyltransferase-like isoleucine patch superfamily enzyme